MNCKVLLSTLAGCLLASAAFSADALPYAPWVEPDFPFFSSILDVRANGPKSVPWNITPRGLVLNLGLDTWACFDTDLLRITAIWSGQAVTADQLAQLSYQRGNPKTIGGQEHLPKPVGTVWLTNGVYPGWQIGSDVSPNDPREEQPSKEEPGRGPLPPEVGQFKAIHLTGRDVVLEYTVADATVHEWVTAANANGAPTVQCQFKIGPCTKPVTLVIGSQPTPESDLLVALVGADPNDVKLAREEGVWVIHVVAHKEPLEFSVAIATGAGTPTVEDWSMPALNQPSDVRWPQEVVTRATLSTARDAYVMDDIALPLENPWRRNVRLCDIGFLPDGRAAGVTVDGDVWLISGLGSNLGEVHWKRFASGLHEPMGLVVREGQIFVFDRNGIWRLVDTNGDGVADVYELFSNVFPQSAESREFPNSIKLAPDGAFVISKGGQQASTISKLNGSVLRVAPDGKSYTVLGVGFRQPFAGVNPKTGLVTSSDQEGEYVPTTPLYIVKDGTYHGFLSALLPKEKYPAPIADPLTWIPHSINPSGATQVWLAGAKLGALNDSLVHIGFNRPELFRVMMNERGSRPQASVVSIIRDFDLPALNGTVCPADGDLYVTGFQVIEWGTTAKRVSGLMRLRATGAPCTLPREVVPMDQGVLIRFDVPLDPQRAVNLASYSLESWHYRRAYKYGSPHLKADETPGQDWVSPSSVYVSKDARSVFVGVPGMKPVAEMRIGWSLAAADGAKVEDNAYFTPWELTKFDPVAEGFGELTVDLTPKASSAPVATAPTVEEGRRLYQLMGCMACHAIDDTVQLKIGPPWKGLFGKMRQFANAPDAIADEAYIRESILTPQAKTVKGYEKVEAGMPVYAGVLTDSQIDSIILFIKTLR